MKDEVKIRFAKLADLPSIVDIYNQAIRSQIATGDLTEFDVNERQEWFNKFTSEEYPIYIAEINNIIVGYCSLSPYRPGREALATAAEISYYVDYSFHGQGIGSALLKYAICDCKRIGKENLLAILLDINKVSIGILEKFGFKPWGHFPNIINLRGKKYSHLVYGLKIT